MPGKLLQSLVVRIEERINGLNGLPLVRTRCFDLKRGTETRAQNQDAKYTASIGHRFPQAAENARPEARRKSGKAPRSPKVDPLLPRHNDSRRLHL